MSPSEKEQLLRLEERFVALDPDQQQQLRQLTGRFRTMPMHRNSAKSCTTITSG